MYQVDHTRAVAYHPWESTKADAVDRAYIGEHEMISQYYVLCQIDV